MSRKTALTASNLEGLGAERLAELLIEIGKSNQSANRAIKLALASAAGPKELAAQIRNRIRTISRSTSFLDWRSHKSLIEDLETQRRLIVTDVARADPDEALGLMWEFMDLAPNVLNRCDDSNGSVGEIFRSACEELGEIASVANPDTNALANHAFLALQGNGYGEFDGLIDYLVPALGSDGLSKLKSLIEAFAGTPVTRADTGEREVTGWSAQDPMSRDEQSNHHREYMIRSSLEAIADAVGDVDGFIALQDSEALSRAYVAAGIARRLLQAGRTEEAFDALEAADKKAPRSQMAEWESVRIDVLEALGRHVEAQELRWARFETSLDEHALRAYLKRLPDFDDMEAEERALELALAHENFLTALNFLFRWPSLEHAACLVETRTNELNGDYYEYLTYAATNLEARYPLAATLVRRAMIDFALSKGRSTRYRHAARHLLECESLASTISDFGGFPDHADYRARLEAEHARKSSFWSKLE